MCGLVGFLGGNASNGQFGDDALLRRMADRIANRGPDSDGYWLDAPARIALGHRRLAIVDLSPAGAQPMASPSGRYVIAFNGEIYNHLLLRAELERSGFPAAWRGHSDTETLLAGFDHWGIEGTLQRAVGMFAIALWDQQQRLLTLARDRLGEKPLYYGWQGRGDDAVFLFGSELKALRVHPAFDNTINRGAVSLQLRHSYIPAPHSIYQGISKLMPGTTLTISMTQRSAQPRAYWSGIDAAMAGVADPFTGSPDEAVSALETLLEDAIKQQMMADVPLGAFLSGGVDSSAIVALMQKQSARPVKTFTMGFNETGFDEAQHAMAVARHLGTEHTEMYVTPAQALAVVPRLPTLYDEPFSDSSQIPTFLVSQLARKDVTVSLSGDAGDELFCGYNRYQMSARWSSKIQNVPLLVRKAAANAITSVAPNTWSQLARNLSGLVPRAARMSNMGDKLHKAAGVLRSATPDELYMGLVSHWTSPAAMVIDGAEAPTLLNQQFPELKGLDPVQRMMVMDMLTYLPDDILTKVDRAAMGVSLETRVPFLDHRVVEFAWRLPQSLKLRDGQTKWALRQVLYRHVPAALIERPKMGFGVPIGEWLRGPLRDWAETLLDEGRLRREGFFVPEPIRAKWREHLSGRRNWEHHLWSVLMFQAWFEQQ